MKTNVTLSANRIMDVLTKVYIKEVEKNISSCSRLELLAKIEKNNIAMLNAMHSKDFETATNIATENANILPFVNSDDFSGKKSSVKDTEKDFPLIVERVLTVEQLPIEELQSILQIVVKEAQSILQQFPGNENTNK